MQTIEEIDKQIALLTKAKEDALLNLKKKQAFITRGEVEELIKNLKEELLSNIKEELIKKLKKELTTTKEANNDNGSSKLTFSSFDNTYTIATNKFDVQNPNK